MWASPTSHANLSIYLKGGLGLLLAFLLLFRAYTFFEFTNSDRNLQVWQAIHWLNGNGLSQSMVDEENLQEVHYFEHPTWPPAYPILVAAGLKLGIGVFPLILGLHFLFLLALWVLLWFWARSWLPDLLAGGLMVYWALSFAPLHYVGSTGLAALAFLLGAMYSLFQWSKTLHWKPFVLATTLLVFAIYLRLAYIPFLLLPALALLFQPPKKPLRWWAGLLGLGLVLFLPLLFWYLGTEVRPEAIRSFSSLDEGAGPYWHHLLRMDAFALKSYWFIYGPKLAALLQIPVSWIQWVLGGINLALIGLAGWAMLKRVRKDFTSQLAVSVVGLNLGFLLLLSLLVPFQDWGKGITWTFVEESRYYIPSMLIMQVCLVHYFWVQKLSPRWQNLGRIGLLSLGLIGLFHSGYRWHAQLVLQEKGLATGSTFDQDLRSIYAFVKNTRVPDSQARWIYAKDQYTYHAQQVVAGWAGAQPVFLRTFLRSDPQRHAGLQLYFHLSADQLYQLQKLGPLYFDEEAASFLGIIQGLSVWLYEIPA
ncbi:MAG: hypothetical protein AAFP92_29135, partial [Bacteroidota bacterium]